MERNAGRKSRQEPGVLTVGTPDIRRNCRRQRFQELQGKRTGGKERRAHLRGKRGMRDERQAEEQHGPRTGADTHERAHRTRVGDCARRATRGRNATGAAPVRSTNGGSERRI